MDEIKIPDSQIVVGGEGEVISYWRKKVCCHTVFYSNGWKWLEGYYCYEIFSIVVITLK